MPADPKPPDTNPQTSDDTVVVSAADFAALQAQVKALQDAPAPVAAPSDSSTAKVEFKEATVISDGYQYHARDQKNHKLIQATSLARRGQKVTVPADEYDRGRQLGVLGSDDDLKRHELNAQGLGVTPDEGSLQRMTAPEVLAYLSAHTDDLDRIEELEKLRGDGARSSVLRAIEVTREINDQLANDGK